MFKNKWYLSQMFPNDHCHWSNVLQGQRERSVSSEWRLWVTWADLNLWSLFSKTCSISGLEWQGWKPGLTLKSVFRKVFFYSSLGSQLSVRCFVLSNSSPPWRVLACVMVVAAVVAVVAAGLQVSQDLGYWSERMVASDSTPGHLT